MGRRDTDVKPDEKLRYYKRIRRYQSGRHKYGPPLGQWRFSSG